MRKSIIIDVPEGWEIDEAAVQKVALRKKPRIFHGGDRFQHIDGGMYILARVDINSITLINLKSGNRWATPIIPTDTINYYEQDLNLMAGRDDWNEIFTFISPKE